MVFPRDLHGGFRGFRTAGNEKHPSHAFRGHPGDLPGQVDLGRRDELAVCEGYLAGLIGHGLGDLLHAVAYADHVHSGTGVEVGPAFRIIQVTSLAVRNPGPLVLAGPVKDMPCRLGSMCHVISTCRARPIRQAPAVYRNMRWSLRSLPPTVSTMLAPRKATTSSSSNALTMWYCVGRSRHSAR